MRLGIEHILTPKLYGVRMITGRDSEFSLTILSTHLYKFGAGMDFGVQYINQRNNRYNDYNNLTYIENLV